MVAVTKELHVNDAMQCSFPRGKGVSSNSLGQDSGLNSVVW